MDDVLPRLAKAKVFSVCDVRHGYWHVQLDKESSMLTTFISPGYRWTRMPFGIKPASEIFQQKLDQAIEGLPCRARIADDILVWGDGNTQQEAAHNHLFIYLLLFSRWLKKPIRDVIVLHECHVSDNNTTGKEKLYKVKAIC